MPRSWGSSFSPSPLRWFSRIPAAGSFSKAPLPSRRISDVSSSRDTGWRWRSSRFSSSLRWWPSSRWPGEEAQAVTKPKGKQTPLEIPMRHYIPVELSQNLRSPQSSRGLFRTGERSGTHDRSLWPCLPTGRAHLLHGTRLSGCPPKLNHDPGRCGGDDECSVHRLRGCGLALAAHGRPSLCAFHPRGGCSRGLRGAGAGCGSVSTDRLPRSGPLRYLEGVVRGRMTMTSWLQDPSLMAAILTTWLPFVSFLLIIVFTRDHRRLSAGLSIAAVTGSLAGAVFLLARHWSAAEPIHYAARWLIAGDIYIPFGFLFDPLSLLMLLLVASISFLVQVSSLGYMAGDPGFSRYYAFQSLFAWAMMSLSISSAMLQLYVFWELVGLSSYLLIGFWYERFSATQAGKKAFVMTRLGDVAFFIGLLLVLLHLEIGRASCRERV